MDGSSMTLTDEQELRRNLLLKMLDRHDDPAEALPAAARLEQFILSGRTPPREHAPPSAPATPDGGCPAGPRPSGGSGRPARRSTSASPGATRKRRWTDEEEGRLREMWREGTSVARIAQQLGRSNMGIRHRAHTLGLSRNRPSSRQ